MEGTVEACIEHDETGIRTQLVNLLHMDVHAIIIDRILLLLLCIEGLFAPTFGHIVSLGILGDSLSLAHFLGTSGHFATQKTLDAFDVRFHIDGRFVTVEVLCLRSSMMMEKQHVEVFALNLVQVKILARKLEGEIIELHRISR